MSVSTQSVEVRSRWGPAFAFGITFAMFIFGVSIGQVVFYYTSFPKDSRLLKFCVFVVFLLDLLHTGCVIAMFWHILVLCRGATSSGCQIKFTWDVLGGLILNFFITLIVHSFYAHRVWIISRKNKVATGAIIFAASLQILFGIFCVNSVFYARNWPELLSHPYAALASTASLFCDMLIIIFVAYFLRLENSQSSKRDHPIHKLKRVVMELGLMSFIVSVLAVAVLVIPRIEIRQYWVCIPTPFLAKVYCNSMFAVLNSRRTIRERHFQVRGQMYALTTIRITDFNSTHPN